MANDYKIRNKKQRDKQVEAFGREPASLEDLFEFIRFSIDNYSNAKVTGLKWDISYRTKCSNSHSCPILGETNWSNSNKKAPTCYPGFTGRVWVRYADAPSSFGSDPFRHTFTYTGTGGGGGYDGPWQTLASVWFKRYGHGNRKSPSIYPEPNIYSWDYKVWIDDWPEIKNLVGQETLAAKLRGKSFSINSRLEWFDEATVKADCKFIEEASKYIAAKA